MQFRQLLCCQPLPIHRIQRLVVAHLEASRTFLVRLFYPSLFEIDQHGTVGVGSANTGVL